MNINVPVSSNHPPGYAIIQGNQTSILTSPPPAPAPLQQSQPPVSGGGDVHICGTCGSQYTEIKEFVDHKRQGCQSGGAIGAPGGGQFQPQMHPAPVHHHATHGSVQVGMPVGMPHVILQAPSGPPQMYRIVLEPSVTNSSSQGQSILAQALTGAQVPHLSQSPAQHIQHTHAHGPHSPQQQQESVGSVVDAVTTSSGATSAGLIQLPSVSEAWQPHSSTADVMTTNVAVAGERGSVVERSVIENSLGASVNTSSSGGLEAGPARLDGSNNSNMHTEEEDVATFLATQLASQAAPQQNTNVVSEHLISSVVNGVHGADAQMQYTSAPTQPHPQTQQLSTHHQQQPVVSYASVMKPPPTSRKSIRNVVGGEQNQATVTIDSKSEAMGSNAKEMVVVFDGVRKEKVCPVKGCSFTTTHNKDLNRHIRKHTGEKPYRCDVCGTCFSRSDKLKVHSRIHTNVRPYWCGEPNCQYRAIDSGSLRKHMRTHTDERPYRCQLCSYCAKDGSQLTVHLRTHTGDTPFQCMVETCSAAFKTSSDLRRHERLHTGVKPYKCVACDYACAIKSNLTVHMRLNHFQGAKFSCPKCDFQGNSRKHLKEHEKSHANVLLQCELCEHVSTSTTGLRQHMLIHSQEKPFQCRYCAFTCKTTGNLRYHVRNKHGCDTTNRKRGTGSTGGRGRNAGGNSNGGRRANRPACYRRFKCSECGSGFVREDSWRSHMRQHQKHKIAQAISGKVEPDVFSVVVQEDALIRVDQPTESGKESSRGVTSLAGIQPIPSSSLAASNLPSQNSVSGNADPEGSENINGYNSYVITIDGISTVFSNPVRLGEGNGSEDAGDQQSENVQVITSDMLTADSKPSTSQEAYSLSTDEKVSTTSSQGYQLTAGKMDHSHHLYDLSTSDKVTQGQNIFVGQRENQEAASNEYLSHTASHQVQQTILVDQKPRIDNLANTYQGHTGLPTKLPKTE